MQPRSRSARNSVQGKEAIEKSRLQHRTGGYFRYEDIANPIDVAKGCPSHIDSKSRMLSGPHCNDIAVAERERTRSERNERTEARRNRGYEREDSRWRAISAQEVAAVERQDRMQKDPMIGRKNLGCLAYDVVSHAYAKNPQGQLLKHHDDMVMYRGKVRTAHLAVRNHLGFDPITGTHTQHISLPPLPRPPVLPNPITGV